MAKIKTIYFDTKAEATRARGAAMRGKKYLGNGAFATAYLNKCKRRVTKIGGLNDAYLHFATLVIQENSKNPFLPKIYSASVYKASPKALKRNEELEDEGFYVIEMERLHELESIYGDNYGTVVGAFENIVEWGGTLEDFIKRNVSETKGITGMFSVTVRIEPKAMQFIKHLRQLVGKAIRRHGDDDCSWDIHEGNIMARKNGQVVLTDPIA